MKTLRLDITGIVQGVGFRPFVYNLAIAEGLSGWVLNASDGVHVVIHGPAEVVDGFEAKLRAQAPPMSVIESIAATEVEADDTDGFEIRESHAQAGEMTLVSPDIATCPDCATEMHDPRDRRYYYPFTNCTNCGPRFTIIEDVPYDRPTTTMRDFPMCDECAAEYMDPRNRRFHAQPNACFVCGPRLYLNPGRVCGEGEAGVATAAGTEAGAAAGSGAGATAGPDAGATPEQSSCELPVNVWSDQFGDFDREWAWTPEAEAVPRPHRDKVAEEARARTLLEATAALLLGGKVVAIKGLGGFHLACDATNEAAVTALRERKHRWGKPLAIMVADVETARQYCEVNDAEEALLAGTVRPIVLLKRADGAGATGDAKRAHRPQPPLAQALAPGLQEIGVMLPYTPLHQLLLQEVGHRPLVMTSGNLSDEPIATANAEALERLGTIADGFLLNDRDIYSRYDDSVVRVVGDIVEPVRRARGYAPHPLKLPFTTTEHILAAGPEQKNTFTLLKDGYAFVSQHIGDLENAETLASYESTIRLYERLFRIKPAIIAHDLHPEYLSTKWALAQGLPLVGIQHHHAHIVSVTAEHGVDEPVIGFAFDGTGYGEDGKIWGGEVLVANWSGYERAAHLRYVPMPGGAAAVKRPARMAIGTLAECGLLEHPGVEPLRSRLAEGEERTLLAMIAQGLNSPMTSSMGRLFDAVAAIAGVADDARYEGEAAILLEACADHSAQGSYEFGIQEVVPHVIDPTPVLRAALDDVAAGVDAGVISMRFHRAVVAVIATLARRFSGMFTTRYVALSGGVMMNRIVLAGAVEALSEVGLNPLTHKQLPMNDAAVSFGQAVVAWARRQS